MLILPQLLTTARGAPTLAGMATPTLGHPNIPTAPYQDDRPHRHRSTRRPHSTPRAFGKLKARSVIGPIGSDEVIVLDSDRLRQIGKVGRDAGRAVAATDR